MHFFKSIFVGFLKKFLATVTQLRHFGEGPLSGPFLIKKILFHNVQLLSWYIENEDWWGRLISGEYELKRIGKKYYPVRGKKLERIIVDIEKNRIYPYQNIGSHIVGYVDIDNKGRAGVEAGFDELLYSGKDIYLTLDIILQK